MSLYGRKVIYTDVDEITEDNVVSVLEDALLVHEENAADIDYLYNYYKGKQPILERIKEIRPEICNKIVENRAQEIVEFKTGYLAGEPIQYVATSGDEDIANQVSELNKMMLSESKASKDKSLIEWDMICGTAYRFILPDTPEDEDDAPFEIETLDPRRAFVVYSSGIRHRPMIGVYYTVDKNGDATYAIYSRDMFYEIKEVTVENEKSERETLRAISKMIPYTLGKIPIIEYPANLARLGSFETVITMLDGINDVDSNRLDGVEQFIQSLAVAVNCHIPDDVTLNDITASGIIELKNVGDNKAEFKILTQQLDQSQTQTLKDDMYDTVLSIVGMPSQAYGSNSDSSNNGAVILRNGWQQAEARAKDSELMFKESEQEFIKLVLRILHDLTDITLRVRDIDYRFTRRCYENIQVKSQVLTQMLGNEWIAPQTAYNACGMFTDPETECLKGIQWHDSHTSIEDEVSENDDAV